MSYPKVTLKADFENVNGTIGNLEGWQLHDSLVRADLLSDWIGLLTREYKIALDQDFHGGKKAAEMIKALDAVNH